MNDAGFTHLDESGAAHMVDVGDKDATRRRAVARSVVSMEATTAAAIADGDVKKGDVLAVARIAGIQAAKRTADDHSALPPVAVEQGSCRSHR